MIFKIKDFAIVIMGQSPSSDLLVDEHNINHLPFIGGGAEMGELFPKSKRFCPAFIGSKTKEHDVIISARAPVGKTNIADKEYILGRGACAVRLTCIAKELAWYFYESIRIKLEMSCSGTGTTFEGISKADIENIEFNLPINDDGSIDEISIAEMSIEFDNLDEVYRKTLNNLKQKLIHLDEYKTALIHNAVTKGLDAKGCRILDGTPAAEMKWKDSGVEWIGDVPDGWDVEKVKSITSNYDGMRIPLSAENRVEGEYPYHGANSIQGYVKDYIFDGDHVLVGEDGAPFFELGKNVSRVVSGKFWVNNHAHILKPLGGYSIKFINEALNSVDYRDYISGSTRDKLTKGQLSSIVLPYPSIKEAEMIGSYLINKDAVIELAKQAINKKIALLVEYKKSLINNAVSGGA